MIRILIVDDHQIVIDGIRSLLSSEKDIICEGWANSGREAFQKLENATFEIVLLDINMPVMDGLKTCELILHRHPHVKIIALTMLEERSMIKAMVKAGAKGYLLKNVGHEELVRAIKRVHNGKSHYSEEIAEILLSPDPKQGTPDPELPKLSSREKQILQLIIDELTTAQISEELHISTNTVETHRRNIMHKLGAKNTAGMVRIAIQHHLIDPS